MVENSWKFSTSHRAFASVDSKFHAVGVDLVGQGSLAVRELCGVDNQLACRVPLFEGLPVVHDYLVVPCIPQA